MDKHIKWYKIANNLNDIVLNDNNMAELEVNGKKICVHISNENIKACASKCPHAGGSMSAGYIDALGNIVCPLHRYKFSLTNGRNTSGEGYYLKTYPTKATEKGVFIGIEEKGILNWFK